LKKFNRAKTKPVSNTRKLLPFALVRNLSTVDYKYLLTTTHIVDEAHKNTDIKTAHFRQIDLFASPFNFDYDAPLDRVSDYPDGAAKPRDMILVEKAKVPTFIKEPA